MWPESLTHMRVYVFPEHLISVFVIVFVTNSDTIPCLYSSSFIKYVST